MEIDDVSDKKWYEGLDFGGLDVKLFVWVNRWILVSKSVLLWMNLVGVLLLWIIEDDLL